MLFPLKYFEPIFTPLQNKRIGYIQNRDNIGGQLHQQGALQLFEKFNIKYIIFKVPKKDRLNWDEKLFNSMDEYVVSGGGVMGKAIAVPPITMDYPAEHKLKTTLHLQARIKALKTGKRVTIFPQSFVQNKEDLPYYKVYAREHISQQFFPGAILAPDLALGLDWCKVVPEPTESIGIWLKTKTYEGIIHHPDNLGDPVDFCKTIDEYINLAAKYKVILTDRCHFAIAGLIANQYTKSQYKRTIVLAPNTYHKNLGLWESWLYDLGVKFHRNQLSINHYILRKGNKNES